MAVPNYLSVFTGGWFQTDGLAPSQVEVFTDGWFGVLGYVGKMCLEILVVLPTLEALILLSDVGVVDKRPTLEVEEAPCP